MKITKKRLGGVPKPSEVKCECDCSLWVRGEAEVETTGEYHCSNVLGKVTLKYEVTCQVKKLSNTEGFAILNTNIVEWFNRVGEVECSCEMFAHYAAYCIYAMIEYPLYVKVRIWGLPDAYSEVIYPPREIRSLV